MLLLQWWCYNAASKIVVIGSPGAGKSTFSRQLGERFGWEVVHLDQLYWRENWTTVPLEVFDERLEHVLCKPFWVIDGNYGRTMERRIAAGDTVVFFGLPRRVCLTGVLRRLWQYRGRTRPDMPDGCKERLDLPFLFWIWRYQKQNRPGVLQALEAPEGKAVYVVHSRAQLPGLLDEITSDC